MTEFGSLWDAALAGQVALQTCADCGHQSLLPRPMCPNCLSEDRAWQAAPRSGVVDSVTRVHRPSTRDVASGYQLALVRLHAGPKMLARVTNGEVAIDDEVEVGFSPADPDGRRLPVVLPRQTLLAALREVASASPDAVAVIDAGRAGHPSTTFADLVSAVEATAGVLADAGLRRGDVLLNWLPNVCEWLTLQLAAGALGVVAVPLNTRFRESELADALTSSEAAAIAVPTGFLAIGFMDVVASVLGQNTVAQAQARWPSLRCVLAVDCSQAGDAPAPTVTDAIDLAAAVGAASTLRNEDVTGRPEDPWVAFSTSGTTGHPKLALHTQAAVTTHARHVAEAFALGPGTCLFSALPLYGVFGFSGAIAALLSGGTIVLEPVFDGAEAASLFEETQVTHCYGPDTMLQAILDGADSPEQLRSWQAGGFANFSGDGPAVARRVENLLGVRLRGVYGSSEVFALMSLWPEDAPAEQRLQGGGRPVSPDIHVRAVDPQTGDLQPPGSQGELQVRGYNVTVGYLGNPEATRSSRTDDGWFRTGDLGYVRDDETFVYLARLGDTLRLSGYLVDPVEIETHLIRHPAVRRAAVVGVSRAKVGDVAVGFVELEEGADVSPTDLRAFCRERIAAFKVPREIAVIDELPSVEGPNGRKIQRKPLRDQAEEMVTDSG